MTRRVLDVVNFNADASCLAAADWLSALSGGEGSRFVRWLDLYVRHRKRIALGLIGGTAADLARHNPEAVARIRSHPENFEIVLRPFAHDVALLRSPAAFRLNVELGRRVLTDLFGAVSPFYLPPEFMLTNEQVCALASSGVRGVFINSRRFPDHVAREVPSTPYLVEGILGARLECLPLRGLLTQAYLDALHDWSAAPWNAALASLSEADPIGSWRDGESWLLIPDGLAREEAWLAGEDGVERITLERAAAGAATRPPAVGYPVHSFASWVRELRMLGFLGRVERLEQRLSELPPEVRIAWLQAANSDVLSAVEKESPCVRLATAPPGAAGRDWIEHLIARSVRGLEGEEYLVLAEGLEKDPSLRDWLGRSESPHVVKLRGRIDHVLSTVGVPDP